MKENLIKLNPQQQKACDTKEGPVLVLAGAGAGKTKTLTTRVISLIEGGVMPQNILAITFTNKAAAEMRDRITSAIKDSEKLNFPVLEENFLPTVSTFHSLGVKILRENFAELGVSKYFSIYDRNDSRRTLKEAIVKNELDPKEFDTKKIISIISKNKGDFITVDDFAKNNQDNAFVKNLSNIWKTYERLKKEDNALDFDDLLLETAKLLEKNMDVRNHYQRRWKYVHIDEYQDTNKAQYNIVKFLVNPLTNNIFAVGDPDQNIYSWRGSDITNIMNFQKDFSDAEVILMEQNYRSTKTIIGASNDVIALNKNRFEKKLFTEKEDGEKITLNTSFDGGSEAIWVARKIKYLIEERKVRPSQIAVLYRANFQSRLLEDSCLKQDIPYQVLGTKFFDRAEVKDVISYIKAALDQKSLVDVKRVINSPKRGIGKVSLLKIFSGLEDELSPKIKNSLSEFRSILSEIKKASEDSTVAELIEFVVKKSGLEAQFKESKKEEDIERIANMYELSLFAKKYDHLTPEDGILKFLEDVALMSDQDSKKEDKNLVTLMTIHASKGLEFKYVFLTGAEESMFTPLQFSSKKDEEEKQEEERRLFYVAMTRAEEKLFFSWAGVRTVFGKAEYNEVCPFILDIEPEFIEEEENAFSGKVNQTSDSDDEEIVYLDF